MKNRKINKSKIVAIIISAILVVALGIGLYIFLAKDEEPEHTHSIVTDERVEPTCTETGLTEGSRCSTCGEIIKAQEQIPAKGHSTETVKGYSATCTEDGKTDGEKCSACGEILKAQEEIPPLGHTLSDDYSKDTKNHWKVCTVCGEVATEKEPHTLVDFTCICGYKENCTHTNTAWVTVKEPSCTEDGKKEERCSACGNVLGTSVIDKTLHTPETVKGTAATCEESGLSDGKKCSECGEILEEQKEISAIGHEYGAPVFTWSAYASATAKFTCTNDASHAETLTAAVTSSVTTSPTCTETGVRTYTAEVIFNGKTYKDTKTETMEANGHSLNDSGVCTVCGHNEGGGAGGNGTYTRVDENGNESATGEYILFGTYPQSEVTGTNATDLTNLYASTLPTSTVPSGWTSYKYYKGSGSVGSQSNTTDYMWYKDVTYNGEWYRGVYLAEYRPEYTFYHNFLESNTQQDNNGYIRENVYWFKYEPIKWRILNETNGEALLLCEMLIDCQDYYYDHTEARTIGGNNVNPNNYEHSNIRKWLNNEFYNTSFSELEKNLILLTTVDNSVESTGYSSNPYACKNTEDYIFLPSAKEVLTEEYGFYSNGSEYDAAKLKLTTAYAKCQGASSYGGSGYWLLRSPSNNNNGKHVRAIGSDGYMVFTAYVDITHYGVCPALRIRL